MAARKVRICDRTVLHLIKEIKNRPCLWNIDDEHYNDRNLILTAWEQITATLELPEDLLRAKWKNLRDLFKREVKKFNVKTVDGYTGKWRHFKTLWFLNRHEDATFSSDDTSDAEIKDEKITYRETDPTEFEVYEEDTELRNRKRTNSVIEEKPFVVKRRCHDDIYDKMFLKSLTPFFRQLVPWRKLVVRNKIQDIILSELAVQSNYDVLQQ